MKNYRVNTGVQLARRGRPRLIDAEPALAAFIGERLQEGWTPEQISGWIGIGMEGHFVSESTRMNPPAGTQAMISINSFPNGL